MADLLRIEQIRPADSPRGLVSNVEDFRFVIEGIEIAGTLTVPEGISDERQAATPRVRVARQGPVPARAPRRDRQARVGGRDHPAAHEVRLTTFTGHAGKVGEDPCADNLLFTGDSLDALRVLREVPEFAAQYGGRVKLIHIAPPTSTPPGCHSIGPAHPDARPPRPGWVHLGPPGRRRGPPDALPARRGVRSRQLRHLGRVAKRTVGSGCLSGWCGHEGLVLDGWEGHEVAM
jgi:hypothetical protein